MSWTRLAGPQDWAEYKQKKPVELGMDPAAVKWGADPAAFPCLVASTLTRMNMRPDGFKIVSCFVLPADAERLLGREGGAGAGVVGVPAPAPGVGCDYTEFCRYVTANLLTIVAELESVKITNEARYEQRFNSFLADVDQATAGRPAGVSPKAIFGRAVVDEQDG